MPLDVPKQFGIRKDPIAIPGLAATHHRYAALATCILPCCREWVGLRSVPCRRARVTYPIPSATTPNPKPAGHGFIAFEARRCLRSVTPLPSAVSYRPFQSV